MTTDNVRESKRPDHSASVPKDAQICRTEAGRVVGLSVAAVVIAVVVGLPPLTPLITTAPIAWIVIGRLRAEAGAAPSGLFLRWALSVFATALISTAFVWDRAVQSFPYAASAVGAMRQLLAGNADPPGGFVFLTLGMVIFVALSTVSAGILGCVLGSVALGAGAVGAAAMYRSGDNVFQLLLVTVPWWQLAFYAAAIVALPALVSISRSTVLRRSTGGGKTAPEWGRIRRDLAVAGGLWLGAIVLRLALASAYVRLLQRWTLS
jgi:hypothetical protein